MEAKETSTQSDSFAATIKKSDDGKVALVVKSQKWYEQQLNKFKDGEEVSLILTNKKPKRTTQQNRYYWGVYLPLVAESTGERNLNRLHELFKGEFLTEAIVEVLGKPVRIKKSSTELSISDFSKFIMDIEELTGVIAPPTESYGLDPLEI